MSAIASRKYIAMSQVEVGASYSQVALILLLMLYIKHENLNYIHTSHENDADRARRARAFCLIKTVLRRQYIAFSVSVLDEWEWMAKRLAILENVSFAVIPQPPYASSTRGTHIQPLSRQPKALFSNFTYSPTAAEAPEV